MTNRNKQQLPTNFKLTEDDDGEDENDEREFEEIDDRGIYDLAAIKKEKFVSFTDPLSLFYSLNYPEAIRTNISITLKS